MDLGRVIGTVVATPKRSKLRRYTSFARYNLWMKNTNLFLKPLVAVDTLHDAGLDEIVYIVTGGDAVSVIPGRRMPVDVAIVGIVDSLTLLEEADA